MLHINVQQQLGRLTLRADLQLPTQGVTAIFWFVRFGENLID